MGVGFHRLFSHRQFTTHANFEKLLALFGTLSAYAPLGVSIASHQYHHKNSDLVTDESAADRGLFYSLIGYKLSNNINNHYDYNNRPFKDFVRNKTLVFISNNFYWTIYFYATALMLFDYNLFYNMFLIPAVVEHIRLSAIGYFGHKKTLFSYRNFNTNDHSQNNIICGLLGLGLGWHNNHHNDCNKLNLRVRWWEFDIESMIASALSTRKK